MAGRTGPLVVNVSLHTRVFAYLISLPAHDTGLVMLQVAMGGEVISSSVVFEYKARDLPALPSSQHDWLSLDGEHICIWRVEFSQCDH